MDNQYREILYGEQRSDAVSQCVQQHCQPANRRYKYNVWVFGR